jgi:hypothetical protein
LLHNVDGLHPLARFNLGVARSREGNTVEALHHFLTCAIIQPYDIAAWANAAVCALGRGDEALLPCIMSTAIHHMGAEAYDHFRADIEQQGMPPEALALLDGMAIQFLEERETNEDDGFTLRLSDGDGYQTMTILGGPA